MSPTAGRPLGFDPDRVLDAVVDAFWIHGFASTTTEVLESATGVSRSSLLNTFGPKERLCLAAVDRYQARVNTWLVEPLLNGHRGVADVARFFEELSNLKQSSPGSSGCLVVNLSTEAPSGLNGIGPRVDQYRDSLRSGFTAALARAESLGEINGDSVNARTEVLLALAVAINWTARAASPRAARVLANSAKAQVQEWAAH